jgi:hypothetical protein
MYGKIQHVVDEPRWALQTPKGQFLKGMGIVPEEILNNPLLYDLSLKGAWGNSPDTDSLLYHFAFFHYGSNNADLYEGLLLLKKTVYSSINKGGAESLFAARPAKELNSTSTLGSRKLLYDTNLLEDALKTYLKAAGNLNKSETFQYDIMDIVRQVLTNHGQMAYDSTLKYFDQKQVVNYNLYNNIFLKFLQLQEQLMATNKYFIVGSWLQQTKIFGKSAYEMELAEKNARMQITIWGSDNNPQTDLHSYAHKEWAGLRKICTSHVGNCFSNNWIRNWPVGHPKLSIILQWIYHGQIGRTAIKQNLKGITWM